MSHDPTEAVIARFADPRLGLRASREELMAWVAEGPRLEPPLRPEAAIRRMLPVKHPGLVRRIAPAYLHRGLDLDDLISEGTLGLIHAARLYDPRKLRGRPPVPAMFSTYATPAIHQKIRRALGERGHAIRIPEYLERYLGPRPPIGPLTKWEAEGLEDARRAIARSTFSLSGGNGNHPSYDLAAPGVDAADIDPDAGRATVAKLLAALGERERAVILARHGFAGQVPTFRQMTAGKGVTWQSIQQVERRAMRRLKAAARRGNITYESVFGEAR